MRSIFIAIFCIFFLSCSSDNQVTDKKQSKEILSMIYNDKLLDFKEVRQGKFTNTDRELIGFFIESEIIIDSTHKNKFLMLFKTDFISHIEFEGIEFSPFKPNPVNPNTTFAYVYQYTLPEYNSPFTINLKIENGRIIGDFEGYVHRSNDPNDMKYIDPIYLSNGKIDIELPNFK
ncbi:hypothetical protein [Myroides sp. WP-1]|uniref:hypothetical protein n=1 Tax=Myroides sp. WP-1 TaxID=2759944 RepID=UPI0015FD906B|nr:hypothetical protein [Myroides sp. WP-1]MBB1139173.1 hypothetical protein [Myroides sp. WP-1]